MRDIVSIVQSRLTDRGFRLADDARSTILINYQEMPGPSVNIVRYLNDRREVLTTTRSIAVQIRVRLVRPQGELLLGDSTAAHPDAEVEADPGDIRPNVGRYRRRLYQRVYARSVGFLRSVQLPSARPGH